jgi:hypothetical protein
VFVSRCFISEFVFGKKKLSTFCFPTLSVILQNYYHSQTLALHRRLEALITLNSQNPYVLSSPPCGSSTGPAIAAAANMAAVTLGTETDGSILCPSSLNSVVGIKPTVGLTSRAGVIPISPRQDTVGYAYILTV